MWEQFKRIIKPNGVIVMTTSQPFTSKLIISNPKMFRYEIIWEKEKPTNFFHLNKQIGKRHENIVIFYKKQPTYNPQMFKIPKEMMQAKRDYTKYRQKDNTVITGNDKFTLRVKKDTGLRYPKSIIYFSRDRTKLHPTQKPVALMEYLIKTYTNEKDTVLDNCMGSFTTAIACLNTKRDFIGIELDDKYFEIGKKRVEEHIKTLDYKSTIEDLIRKQNDKTNTR